MSLIASVSRLSVSPNRIPGDAINCECGLPLLRLFYKSIPSRSVEAPDSDVKADTSENLKLLKEVAHES